MDRGYDLFFALAAWVFIVAVFPIAIAGWLVKRLWNL